MTNTTTANNLYPVANATASSKVFVDVFANRAPTPQDVQYGTQQKWLDTVTGDFYILEGFSSAGGVVTAIWIKLGGSGVTETLTGNTGGPVPPTGNNINILGDGTFITTVGNPGTSTITIEPAGGIATTYVENTGSATPSGGVLNVLGGSGVTTSGAGNTITINSTGAAFNYTNVTHAMSPYTVLTTDFYLSVDCSGGTVTLDFPNAPTAKQVWIVKDRTGSSATNHITITTPGGTVTFDGSTSYTISTNFFALNLLANATPTYEVF